MTPTGRPRLERYEVQLRRLAAELSSEAGLIGWLAAGSLVRRSTACGKSGCRCQAEPPQLHGPYWQWTKKVNGKTVTRRLTDEQARLFQEWLGNRQRLQRTLSAMEAVSDKATAILLKTNRATTSPGTTTDRSRSAR
jgi:hypothetical protein